MIKFAKTLQLRDQTDCLQSCFGKVLGGAIMKFKLKDPGSAITHGIAFLLAAVGAAPLLIRSSEWSDHIHIVALGVFILTMMLLYAASTLYHSVDSTAKVNRRLKKLDHMMIFVMIAGSYTPVCLIVLHNKIGYILCALVWATAILGIVFLLCCILEWAGCVCLRSCQLFMHCLRLDLAGCWRGELFIRLAV